MNDKTNLLRVGFNQTGLKLAERMETEIKKRPQTLYNQTGSKCTFWKLAAV